MKPKTTLRLNGKPLDLNPPSKVTLAMQSFFTARPNDIYTSKELHSNKFAHSSVSDFPHREGCEAYCHFSRGMWYFGHPSAIKEFKRLLAEQVR